MNREYQYNFSESSPYLYDTENRERKARTMLTVLHGTVHGVDHHTARVVLVHVERTAGKGQLDPVQVQ